MRNPKTAAAAVLAALAGAALLIRNRRRDPQTGQTWRARLARKCRHTSDAVGAHARDVSHRARGAMMDLRASTEPPGETPDAKLRERVRSRLGHIATHVHSLEVAVEDGVVSIKGPIAEGAAEPLLEEIALVPGIRAVEGALIEESATETTPNLKPHRRRPSLGPRPQIDNVDAP